MLADAKTEFKSVRAERNFMLSTFCNNYTMVSAMTSSHAQQVVGC